MARHHKNPKVTPVNLDVESIAAAVAKAMTSELKTILREQGPAALVKKVATSGEDVVQIDESIIPTTVSIDAIDSNLTSMAKEQIEEDTSIEESKNKLAKLLKRKDK